MMRELEMMEWSPMLGGLGWILMLLIWVTAIIGLIYVLQHFLSWRDSRSRQTPLDVLKGRYANGEMSEEEYNRMKKELK